MSAWGGFSPPGPFLPQVSTLPLFGAAPPAEPLGLALPAFDINYALSFYGVSNVNRAGILPYPYGRKKRSTTERKKRFLPGEFGKSIVIQITLCLLFKISFKYKLTLQLLLSFIFRSTIERF